MCHGASPAGKSVPDLVGGSKKGFEKGRAPDASADADGVGTAFFWVSERGGVAAGEGEGGVGALEALSLG